jgi:hypothetical protein
MLVLWVPLLQPPARNNDAATVLPMAAALPLLKPSPFADRSPHFSP